MGQLDFDRILICVTMRTEDTRGEALERRNRLLRDERFREISLPAAHRSRRSANGSRACSAARRVASCMAYLLRYSEGNPLLATQLLRTLLEEHAVRYEHGRWGLRSERDHALPAVLTGIMERRLDRLSPNTRKILNTAAVIGRVFDIDVAMAAGAGSEDEALDAIDECIAHAVIEPWRDTSGTHFSFTHRLLVDAVHRAINPRRLARIHERVAEAMETHTPDNAAEIAIALRPERFDEQGISATRCGPAARRCSSTPTPRLASSSRSLNARRAIRSNARNALQRLAEVAETEGRYTLTEELCDRALAGLDGSYRDARDPRTSPHARGHSRPSGPGAQADDRRVQ